VNETYSGYLSPRFLESRGGKLHFSKNLKSIMVVLSSKLYDRDLLFAGVQFSRDLYYKEISQFRQDLELYYAFKIAADRISLKRIKHILALREVLDFQFDVFCGEMRI